MARSGGKRIALAFAENNPNPDNLAARQELYPLVGPAVRRARARSHLAHLEMLAADFAHPALPALAATSCNRPLPARCY